MGLKDLQGLQAYLGLLALEDLESLDPRGLQDPQDLQPSWEQVSPLVGSLGPILASMIKATRSHRCVRTSCLIDTMFPSWGLSDIA